MNCSHKHIGWVIWPALLAAVTGCQQQSVNKLVNPYPDGAVAQTSGIYSLYRDQLLTGGGLGLFPTGDNQSIDLQDQSAPTRTLVQMRYDWNGQDIYHEEFDVLEHTFAGFSLVITQDFTGLESATPKDLSGPGYTKLKFSARGVLSQNTTLLIEGPDNATSRADRTSLELDGSQLTSNWADYTLDNIPAGHFADVRVFVSFSFQYEQPPRTTVPGGGGAVYIDDIRYCTAGVDCL